MFKEVPLNEATRLINHGPVVLVSSKLGDRTGVTPVAWSMPVQKNPPFIMLEIGRKHFIYECIGETGDFVVNIPSVKMAETVVGCGSCSGRETDKISVFGLSIRPAEKVVSPVISDCPAFLECELVRDEYLLERGLVKGKVLYAGAEQDAFSGHWLFENKDYYTLHHLGNKVFCFPGGGLIDLRGKG